MILKSKISIAFTQLLLPKILLHIGNIFIAIFQVIISSYTQLDCNLFLNQTLINKKKTHNRY